MAHPKPPPEPPKKSTPPPVPSSSRSEGEQPALDVANVEGRMKKRAAAKLTQLVDAHPDEAVGALRRWLHGQD